MKFNGYHPSTLLFRDNPRDKFAARVSFLKLFETNDKSTEVRVSDPTKSARPNKCKIPSLPRIRQMKCPKNLLELLFSRVSRTPHTYCIHS